MSERRALTRAGMPWEPIYLLSIEAAECLGCGRCFKVCGRNVLTQVPLDEEGNVTEDEEDIERYVMTVTNPGDCIGCGACSRVCAKGCQKHGAAPVLEAA